MDMGISHMSMGISQAPCPMALPSFSPDGLDLVAFRPFEDLPWFKGILADQGQAVSKLSPAGVGCPWYQLMLATSKSHFWGLKPPFGHFGSDFIGQNLVAWVPLTKTVGSPRALQEGN